MNIKWLKNENNANNLYLTPSISVVAQIINATDRHNWIGTLFLWLTFKQLIFQNCLCTVPPNFKINKQINPLSVSFTVMYNTI